MMTKVTKKQKNIKSFGYKFTNFREYCMAMPERKHFFFMRGVPFISLTQLVCFQRGFDNICFLVNLFFFWTLSSVDNICFLTFWEYVFKSVLRNLYYSFGLICFQLECCRMNYQAKTNQVKPKHFSILFTFSCKLATK